MAATGSNYQPLFDYFQKANRSPAFPWVYFHSANASVPRAKVLALQGFDEQYNGFGLEDYDLARRLHLAGLPFQYEPQASSLHQRHPQAALNPHLLQTDIHRFLRKHPDLSPLEKQLICRGNYPL